MVPASADRPAADWDRILAWVEAGGGLLIGGQAWYWSYSHDDTATAYPANVLLNRVGLTGLAVTPRQLRRNLVEAIGRNEAAQPAPMRDVDDALLRLRGVLRDYQTALTCSDARFAVSPIEALRELTRLALLRTPPRTTVRLDDHALGHLALDRSSIAEDITDAARLGQFQFGPEDSPW